VGKASPQGALAPASQVLIDGRGQVTRRQPLNHAAGTKNPANDPIFVHEKSCRGCHAASICRRAPGVHDTQGIDQPVFAVSDDYEVGKIGLGLFGVPSVFSGGNDHSGLTSVELIVVRFELTQLDHAKRSPSSAEEDNCAVLGPGKIAFRKGRSIGPLAGEVGKRTTHGHRSSIFWQPR